MKAKDLIGLDISEVYKKLAPWWIIDHQYITDNLGHYVFVRAVKGVVEFWTEYNIVKRVYPENKEL